jgi:lipoprotein-anchoring transpeptidase ErfK/SrfK
MQARIILIMLVFFAAGIGRQVSAQFWGAKQPLPFETSSDQLKPGEFTWAPDFSPHGPILVTVSLDEQRAYAYRNGVLIGTATVSSGKKGHETPTGVFHTLMKDANHRSKKYNNAAMPYTQKITQYGIALHAGGLPGYPSSHGCVHLP